MGMRASSLANNPLAVTRELDGRYDVVLQVRDNLDLIEQVAGVDFAAILAELESAQDFTGITVVTGPVTSWDPNTKVLTVATVKGDKGDTGATGPQGIRGLQGIQGPIGLTGAAGVNGRDGIDGRNGVDGIDGLDGIDGSDLTIEQISYDSNTGKFLWQFSDGTSYVTPDLRGPKGDTGSKGDKGDQGIGVHHIKGTSTTDSEGDFASYGEIDTYTVYGDAAETINLGHFRVNNGLAKDGQHSIMYGSTYDTNSSGIVDNSERLEGKTLYEVQDFSSIHGKPTTLSGYGISDAFTKAEVTTNISNAVADLVNGAPAVLDTLGELSAALANDANFAVTIANSIGDKVTKNTTIVAGTNTQITYDSKGLVTGGATPTTLAGYSISDAYTKTEGDARYESKNANIQSHIARVDNPHGVTKAQVGLGDVDNTSDVNKPISIATQSALDTKQAVLVSGTNIKTVEGQSLLGPGNIDLGKADVGLGNVDNTADSIKNVLSATKWTVGRVLTLGGDATGSVSMDGSANVTLTVSVVDDSHSHAFGNLTSKPTTVAGYGITDVYTKTQTDSNISIAVAGLVNGSPAALDTLNELAAALGNDANFATTVSTSIGTKVTKNADIVAGTSTKVTYDAKGLVIGGTSLVDTDIPVLDWSKITTGKPTTLSGYGISDATPSSHIGTTGASHGVATTSVDGFMSSADKTKLDGIATNANKYVHPTSGVVAGTYTKITVSSNGHATAGSTPTTLAGYSIEDAYTKTEIDSALTLKTNKSDTDSVNMLRADKFLAAQSIANMIYTNGDLTKIRYNNDTDVNYDVLNYSGGNLSTINHYTGGVLRGTTTLSYTNGNLVSAVFA